MPFEESYKMEQRCPEGQTDRRTLTIPFLSLAKVLIQPQVYVKMYIHGLWFYMTTYFERLSQIESSNEL